MDGHRFDSLVRLLGSSGSRRTTLGALLGAALTGVAGEVAAKGKGKGRGSKNDNRGKGKSKGKHKKRHKRQQPAPAQPAAGFEVSAEAADCLNPGPSSNMNDCNFSGEDFDGVDLSSSSMKRTKFVGTSLCGADLFSSALNNADFQNANLTRADLHSSGCAGIKTNAATRFCQTIMCNGSINNSDCPSGVEACCDTDDCPQRACFTVECDQTSACDYEIQANGAPGNLCPAPRECCAGSCCPEGQKCCGSTCIPNDQCCGPMGTPGCPAGQQCCGGETCSACCTGSTPGCGPGQACCGNTCAAGVCCANNTACTAHLQCCGADEDEAACLEFPSGNFRCCTTAGNHAFGNEDSCGLCCPGLTCCEHIITGDIRCEEDINDCLLP